MSLSDNINVVTIDVEAKPGHWISDDWVSKIITAVAIHMTANNEFKVYTHYDYSSEELASFALVALQMADLVTGHNIRRYDLPLINGTLLTSGQQTLPELYVSDTLADLKYTHGRSVSQANLASALGVKIPKYSVTLEEWERFNTLHPDSKKIGERRCLEDVKQNIELRKALIKAGWLGPPRPWYPDRGRR